MTPARRALAWATAGWVGFIVYGSLVPFHFCPQTHSFASVLSGGVRIASRSDAVANLMLGVPLGFGLLGAVCAGRPWARARCAGLGLALLPVCVLFSAAVEYAQLYTVERFCSVSDIVAQGIGALIGMVGWVLCGQRLVDRTRGVWDRSAVHATGQLLLAYLALVGFVQVLPLDLTASPADFYRKLRDVARLGVFGELDGMGEAARWKRFGDLVKLAGLYVPVGLLAARLKGRIETWGFFRLALAAVALGVCLELVQLPVRSRTPSAGDAVVGALAALAGWYAARVHHEGLALPFAASWGIVWFAGMTPVTQAPAGAARLDVPRPFDWVPGLPLESGDPLFALGEVLTKLVLFGLLGVIVAAWRLPRGRGRPTGSVRAAALLAAALGLVVSGFFENGQRWTDTHTPCVTDVLLGGLGAALGVLVCGAASARRCAA